MMVSVCGEAAPTAVGLNSTLTVSVFFLASMKVPLLETEKGGSRAPIMTCNGNLPLFLTLTVFFLVALTFTLPKPRLPETLKVPTGVAVAVAVGVVVPVALAVAVDDAVGVAEPLVVGEPEAVGVADALVVG